MKKRKIRKSKIAHAIAIIISIVMPVVCVVFSTRNRIKKLGGLNPDIGLFVGWLFVLLIIGGVTYVVAMRRVNSIKRIEREEAGKKRLKKYLQEEKEVYYKYGKYDDTETMLKTIVMSYNPHYYARIVDDNSVVIRVINDEGKEICKINVYNLSYFLEYFLFQEN